MPNKKIDGELTRLRTAIQKAESVDPIDVAVVESLAATKVRSILEPILDDGANLTGVTLEAAGTVAGIVQLTFETEWELGTSHISRPDRVVAIVEIEPPKVIKAMASPHGTPADAGAFTAPTGPIPVALRELGIPSASEAMAFNLAANRAFNEWLGQNNLGDRLSGIKGVTGLTTGTKCTSLLCFETTSDDFD